MAGHPFKPNMPMLIEYSDNPEEARWKSSASPDYKPEEEYAVEPTKSMMAYQHKISNANLRYYTLPLNAKDGSHYIHLSQVTKRVHGSRMGSRMVYAARLTGDDSYTVMSSDDEQKNELRKFLWSHTPIMALAGQNGFRRLVEHQGRKNVPFTDAERLLSLMNCYPLVLRRVVNAPYSACRSFAEDMAMPPVALTRVLFAIPDFFQRYLGDHLQAMSNASQTCQFFFYLIGGGMTYCDTRKGNFLGYDSPDNKFKLGYYTVFASMIGENYLTEEYLKEIRGDPNRETGRYNPGGSYYEGQHNDFVSTLKNEMKIGECIRNTGSAMRLLQLHKMTFVNPQWLKAIIKDLPSLDSVAISNCQNIQLCDVLEVMRVVYEEAKSRGKSINLDIRPPVTRGSKKDLVHDFASLGVVWQEQADAGAVNIAVMPCLIKIAILDHKYKFGLLKPGKGLHQYIRELPWDFGVPTRIFQKLEEFVKLPENGRGRAHTARVLDVLQTLYILAAGEPQTEGWMRQNNKTIRCTTCNQNLIHDFFLKRFRNESIGEGICRGCRLEDQMIKAREYFKREIRDIAHGVFAHGINTADLNYAEASRIGDSSELFVRKDIWKLEVDRAALLCQYRDELPQKMQQTEQLLLDKRTLAKKHWHLEIQFNIMLQQYGCHCPYMPRIVHGHEVFYKPESKDWVYWVKRFYRHHGIENGTISYPDPRQTEPTRINLPSFSNVAIRGKEITQGPVQTYW